MIMGVTRRIAAAGVLAAAAGLLATAATAGAAGASQPPRSASAPQRQIGAAELTWFKVVLTATRGPGSPPMATVTAAGYRRSGSGWQLIAVKRIGAPNQWFWYSVEPCSLHVTQFRGATAVQTDDSIRVSLLPTQALGCTKPFGEHWTP
jgi:hypothetical protein